MATYVLCTPDVESSRIPAMFLFFERGQGREGGPSESEGRTIETSGDAGSG